MGLSHRGGGKQSWPAGGSGGGDTPTGPAGGSLWGEYANPYVKEVRSNGATAPIYINSTDGSDGTLVGIFGTSGLVMAAAMALTLGTGGYVALPGTVSTTGDIRGATSRSLMTAASTNGDWNIIRTDANVNLHVGDRFARMFLASTAAGFVFNNGPSAVTTLTVAETLATFAVPIVLTGGTGGGSVAIGSVRAGNNTTILAARNFLNNGDLAVLATNASNAVLIGSPTVSSLTLDSSGGTTVTGGFTVSIASTTRFTVNTSVGIQAGYQIVLSGGTGATSVNIGSLRAGYDTTIIAARNSANSDDLGILATDSSNNLYVGMTAASAKNVSGVRMMASSTVWLGAGGSVYAIQIDSSSVYVPLPILRGGVGASFPATGDMRFANATNILVARNNASGDINVLATGASNEIYVGASITGTNMPTLIDFRASTTGFYFRPLGSTIRVAIADTSTFIGPALVVAATVATAVAAAGDIRGARVSVHYAIRNQPNNGDLSLLTTTNPGGNATDLHVGFGDGLAGSLYLTASNTVYINPNGIVASFSTTQASFNTPIVLASTRYLSLPGTVATTGHIRAAADATTSIIAVRYSGADYNVYSVDTSNQHAIAIETNGGTYLKGSTIYFFCGSGVYPLFLTSARSTFDSETFYKPAASSTGVAIGAGVDGVASRPYKQTRSSSGTLLSFAIPDLKGVKYNIGLVATKAGAVYSINFEMVVRRDGATVITAYYIAANESSAAGPRATFAVSGTSADLTWAALDGTPWEIEEDVTVMELYSA
jgi:hypothetical protein